MNFLYLKEKLNFITKTMPIYYLMIQVTNILEMILEEFFTFSFSYLPIESMR